MINKFLLLICLFIFSCSDREIINKGLIGKWRLIDIRCEMIDTNKIYKELWDDKKGYIDQVEIVIKANSKYIFSLETMLPSSWEFKNGVPEFEKTTIKEYGKIVKESNTILEWQPGNVENGQRKSTSVVSMTSASTNNIQIKYILGPLPMVKTQITGFEFGGDSLFLEGDLRLSYNENKTGRASDDHQIISQLIFKRVK